MKITKDKMHPYLADMFYTNIEMDAKQPHKLTRQEFCDAYIRSQKRREINAQKVIDEIEYSSDVGEYIDG